MMQQHCLHIPPSASSTSNPSCPSPETKLPSCCPSQSQTKVAELQSQLASTSAALTHECMSREAAADEVAGAMAAKEQALQEAER